MSKGKVTLYHSKNCGHCIDMEPEWKKAKSEINGMSGYEANDYERDGIPPAHRSKVKGYPTIIISKGDKEYEYMGKRTSTGIVNALTKELGQMGGGKRDYYKDKYTKYKNKYVWLKNSSR